ncbi:alpha-L-fucosidase [Enterococcus hirae]
MKKFNNWPTDYPDPNWFIHDRFGLFIHFGLFSVGARHEWFMTTEQVSLEEYSKNIFSILTLICLMQMLGQKKPLAVG